MFASLVVCVAAHVAAADAADDAVDDAADVVALAPRDVRHARGLRQRYEVKDHRLFISRDGGEAQRFDAAGDDVAAVFADEDEFFVVVDLHGGLHHHESGVYDSLWGLPTLPFTRAPLSLPFDVAHLRPGRVAYSMRHKNVEHYSDTRGQQFFWGSAGTTTLWALSDDGRALLLGDPWLPPDFSRELCGPARSSIVMESVAASASTVFVMAKNGDLYTRFVDYDSFGGTPFYDYDYGEFDVEGRGGDDPQSELQTRALPAEGWTPQPKPVARRLSRRIAIQQNGKGNDARVLVVVGDNEDGQRGVFHKNLKDAVWSFSPADIDVGDDEFVDEDAAVSVDVPAVAYAGFVAGADGVFARTDDFWFHCSPFHLTLTIDREDVDFTIHTVDAWTLFTNQNPRGDPTAMKSLKATMTLSPGQALSPTTTARVQALFGDRLGVAFAFAVVADGEELVLFPVGYPWNTARDAWQMVLRHDPSQIARRVVPRRPATARFHDVVVRCDPQEAESAASALRATMKQQRAELALARALEAALPGGTAIVDVLTALTTTRWTWRATRWLTGLEEHLPAVLGAQVVSRERAIDGAAADDAAVAAALAACAGSDNR